MNSNVNFCGGCTPVSQACGSPPILGPGGPICLGNWVPPGPKCLGIWVRVIICTSRHLGPGRGRRGGTEFPDAFYLLNRLVLIR